MASIPEVRGHCPMGCGETLFLGSGGYVTCGYLSCPNPSAVTVLLQDREMAHIVNLGPLSFTVQHPLAERLEGALYRCAFFGRAKDELDDVRRVSGGTPTPGLYRVSDLAARLVWQRIP